MRIAVRATPDAADQRHQLYVQWLNARASEPDVLQLDVIWTPEFAAAGWIAARPLSTRPSSDFFPATVAANRWKGKLYALPWFVDVGMLYYRTDLVPRRPATSTTWRSGRRAQRRVRSPSASSGRAPATRGWCASSSSTWAASAADPGREGRVVVDSEAAVRALTFMRDAIHVAGVVPGAVLTWQEEQTRFASRTGRPSSCATGPTPTR